jgi:DNA polymerase III subunit beta
VEFSIDRSELLESLSLTQGVVERRNTLPILANVLLDARERELAVVATDLEVHISRRCAASVKGAGAATVGARKLYEFVRELRPGEVQLRLLENQFVEVSSGRSRVRLVGLPAADFPAFPRNEEEKASSMSLPTDQLARLIDLTLFAVSVDETRAHLGGVYLCGGEGVVRFVGTDGHRLALAEQPLKGAGLREQGVILPRKGLTELRKILDGSEGDVRLTVGANAVRAEQQGVDLVMRLIDGEFPNYEQVIPKSTRFQIAVDRGELLSALKRVSVVASDRARGVKLGVSANQLVVSASSPDHGDASEEIEIEYSGDEMTVGFNSRYLTDVLAVLPDGSGVEIGLTDDVSPGVIRKRDDDTYSYVVMPMRL